jgi:prepilin signal peptidase PulO-like enzyme (type II secretory pathway)
MSHSVICDDQFLSNAGEHLAAQSTAVTMRMTLPIVVVTRGMALPIVVVTTLPIVVVTTLPIVVVTTLPIVVVMTMRQKSLMVSLI